MAGDPRGDARVVLVVEDDADAQTITAMMLGHVGFEVVTASSVDEALAKVRGRRPDVVVLDCRLPDGDGLELARSWCGDDTMRDVPVIVLTAFSARQDVEAALLAGVDAFLVKPVPGPVLVAHVEKVLIGTRSSQRLRVQRP